ncbi:MAG: hypothetical protein KDK38_12760, partial [Leptospiraceae bacterium]|nr:hypothetical protein [Leptospiraceae bacterium]
MVHRRIFLPVLIVSFFAASFGIVSALLYSNSKNTEIAFGHELQSVAQAIAKDIEPQEYYSLFFNKNGELRDLQTAPSSPVFEKYKTKLMQFRKTFDRLNLQHDNLYTFIVPPDLQTQRLYWGIMTHSVPFTGETYKATKTIRNVIENKVAAFSGIYLSTASNKEWVSGYAPIVYQNKVIGVVEVAREVSEVIQESEKNIILPIAISLGIILLFLIALVVILYFAKGLEQKNAELKIAFERINLSETLYRHLFNSGSNIHFALNEKLEMISTNTAFSREFRFSCDSKTHQSFLDLLKNLTPESQAQSILNTGFTESSIRALKRAGQKFEFTSTLVSGATNEAKDFQIIIEKVQDAGEVAFLGKAISLGESMVAGLLARQKAKYILQNSLVHTEHLASHLATLARKFLSEDKSIVLRIVLR